LRSHFEKSFETLAKKYFIYLIRFGLIVYWPSFTMSRPNTRLSAKVAKEEELKTLSLYGLGYDEDGVDIPPWPSSNGYPLRRIESMLAKLNDPLFKVTKKTPDYENPYLSYDGCCHERIETKEKALAYWNEQHQRRLARIAKCSARKEKIQNL
jgi:hypothetical protein